MTLVRSQRQQLSAIPVITFWQFAVFLLKFVSPQVKWDLIFSIRNFGYRLPYLLQILRILGNDRKFLNLRTVVKCPIVQVGNR